MSFNIIGTGSAFPEKRITNHDLAQIMDTSDEWIYSRTGIKARRILSNGETLLDIAEKAARLALENGNTAAEDIDLVIFTTIQGDYITPAMSCLLSGRLGIKSGRQFDINMACSAFVFALDMADSYFKSGKAERVLIVSAEAMSRTVDWNDRATSVLFGDGAAAAVLEKGGGLLSMNLKVEGELANLHTPSVRGNCPFTERDGSQPYLFMDGHEIFKYAVKSITAGITETLEAIGITAGEAAYFVLHQPNVRIIESARKKLGISGEKIPIDLEEKANISSACIPSLIDSLNRGGRLKTDDIIVICGFGAGLTSAACAVRWK